MQISQNDEIEQNDGITSLALVLEASKKREQTN